MFQRKKKKLNYLRSLWSQPVERFRNMDLISVYHNLLKRKSSGPYVDDKTWNDLDMDSVFSKMDRNISGIGQQYLYHMLHKYEDNEKALKKRYEVISYLKDCPEIREKIQLNLLNLNNTSSYFISYLVLCKDLPNTKYYPLFYLCSLLSITSLILIPFKGIFLFAAMGILLINIIIDKAFAKNIYRYFTGFSGLNSLIASAISISKIKSEIIINEIEFLTQKNGLLKSLRKKLGYFIIDKESLNDLSAAFIEYLNMFLLFDVIAYFRSVKVLLKHQDDIHKIYEAVASLDSSISVASYLSGIPFYTIPTFNSTGLISFDNIYHPLIRNAVPNSMQDITKSILITGSNMAGKTTFIKTTGINFILSQTLYFSLAEKYCIPKLEVKSSLRKSDNLEEGKSYFFVEIEELNDFLKLAGKRNKYLFLIDEIFRGTNTLERLASSTAVLKYLNINNKVFVTTHDIELQYLLENKFDIYHFSEQVEDGKFFFNYKIKEGPCSSGNAIKLLEIMSYPESVTEEANEIVKELLAGKYSHKIIIN